MYSLRCFCGTGGRSAGILDTVKGIKWIVDTLRKDQSADGSWAYPFETGISTDAYMIILLRTLEIDDEELIEGLCQRILSKQQKNGAWKLFYDEGEGNVTATLEAYYGLLFSGFYSEEDERLRAAKKFILDHGGLSEVSTFTKIMLALTGQFKWPSVALMPIEMILLPHNFPINFYSFSVFGRANMTPIMILADKKFSIPSPYAPDLSDLKLKRDDEDQWVGSREWRSLRSYIQDGVKRLLGIPRVLHRLAIERAEKYMLDHLEQDGTFYSYYSSTFLMIFALLSLGYKKSDSVIIKAVDGIRAMKSVINGFPHMQYTTANVWNTSLIGYTLQAAGVSHEDPMVMKANKYLLSRQHTRFGDWVVHNPNSLPGGWGFSDVNTMNPDVDDTTASLRSISNIASRDPSAWKRGVDWLLSMQNDNGGWPAFEKNTDSKLLAFLPLEKGRFMLMDPTCADLTGRTLEFFGNYTNLPNIPNSPVIRNAVNWLLRNQRKDGSWYGRWGICFIYGTWGAITGLRAVGLSKSHPSIQKASAWLSSIQNPDGGWGESCRSDIQMTYVPLTTSTLTDTAWALDALIAIADRPTTAIQKGITYLLGSLEIEDWTTDYPKGQGMGGAFYIHYHSYRYIFPLLTLAHYRRKFE
ncbi:squalene--hopene cyclase [Cohnella pontilimi]|uniref:Squalene--hopene cyclase n=1 Tax=Cohnella pontilimi TaxID=2564100 RepID=A0A4U0F991_9BACL|nr:squalene--hopene cyclase [Cohnella pontilimi]TJY41326.1 squalene--hopene cyclase [Cohnella pontilimi]